MKTNSYQLNLSVHGTHRIIASFLKPRETILDIGCNDGYLKKVFPDGVFSGIEYSPHSAKLALKNGFIDVRVGDLNNFKKIKLNHRYNIIVFGDILEHLLFPKKVLTYFVDNNLKKNGRIIVSLPNVANFVIRINLLFGSFVYTKSGILDKTHLHLYTSETAKKLLQNSGLKILSERYSSNHFGFLIKIFPFLGTLLGYNLIYLCQKK